MWSGGPPRELKAVGRPSWCVGRSSRRAESPSLKVNPGDQEALLVSGERSGVLIQRAGSVRETLRIGWEALTVGQEAHPVGRD